MTFDSRSTRWLLYAMGGGLGHFSRTLALARAICAQASSQDETADIHLLTNCRIAASPQARGELTGVTPHVIAPDLSATATRGAVRDAVESIAPEILVVDSFPRGLGGELAELLPNLDALRVLTHRDLNPAYAERFSLHSFVQQNFDLILAPGERGPLQASIPSVKTAPWLLRDRSQLAGREPSRQTLAANGASPLIVVLASGKPSEAGQFVSIADQLQQRLAHRAQVRFVHPPGSSVAVSAKRLPLWPMLPWIQGVDLVVGAGGYNTVYECAATNTPLFALVQPRRYDRQQIRLRDGQGFTNTNELVDAVVRTVESCSFQRDIPDYQNGAHDAVRTILDCYQNRFVGLEGSLR